MRVFVLCLALVPATAFADARETRVRASLYAPYAFQPGVRISTLHDVHAHPRPRSTEATLRMGRVFVSPELSVFGRLGNHVSLSLGAGAGYRFLTPRRGRFHELALNVSYLAEWQTVRVGVDLGSGNTTNTRELRNYFLPSLRYRFGRETDASLGWFLGGSFGYAVSPEVDTSLFFSLEFGLQLRMGAS